MTEVPGGQPCPPWQRGLGIALENIVKYPGNFRGTRSQEWVVWAQHPHLQGHRGPGSVTTRVGGLKLSARTQGSRQDWTPCGEGICGCMSSSSPPSAWPLRPSLPGSPHRSFWPHEPLTSLSSNVLLTSPGTLATAPETVSVRTRLWSFLPITESPCSPSGAQVQGKKGETGSLKEIEGDISDTPYPVPCQQTDANSFHGQEKGKSQEPLKAWRKHQ